MKHYTEAELLAEVKRRLALPEQSCGCVVARQDGMETDKMLAARLRTWYAEMLRGAPAALLPVRDIKERLEPLGTGVFLLPDGVERIVSVRGKGWLRPVRRTVEFNCPEELRSRFPGLEPTPEMPMLAREGRLIELRPEAEPAELLAVAPPEEGFEMNEGLFNYLDLNKLWE